MWHFYYSHRAPFSLQILSKFENFCKLICLDDKDLFAEHTKKYAIKLIPSLVSDSGIIYDGNNLIEWMESPTILLDDRPPIKLKDSARLKHVAEQMSKERESFN